MSLSSGDYFKQGFRNTRLDVFDDDGTYDKAQIVTITGVYEAGLKQ